MPIMNCKICGKEFEYSNGLVVCAKCANDLSAKPEETIMPNQTNKEELEKAALAALDAKDFFQVKKIVNALFYGDPLNSIGNYCQLLCEHNASEPFELKLDFDWENDTLFARALRCCTGEELEKLEYFLKNKTKEYFYRKIAENYRSLNSDEMSIISGYKDADKYIAKANVHSLIYSKTCYDGKKNFVRELADNGDANAKKFLASSCQFSTPCLPTTLIKMFLLSIVALWASYTVAAGSVLFIYISGALLGILFYSFMSDCKKDGQIWAPILGAILARIGFFIIYNFTETLDIDDFAIGPIVLSYIPLVIYGIRLIIAMIYYFKNLACSNLYNAKIKPKYDEMLINLRRQYTGILDEETMDTLFNQ